MMVVGGYYHAIVLSPCSYAHSLYGENGLNDLDYWRHEDGARHLATQLMSRYPSLSVYGFQACHAIPSDTWTDVNRLNACFFSQASRIILFVPSDGEELIKHFSRTCLTVLLTRPKANGGRPDWHSRFVTAAIGNVRVPNQLSQDVPFVNVIRFREVGWMRDVTAMMLLHRAIRDFWTPFKEDKFDPCRWSLTSTRKAEYSLMEVIETTALVGTQTSVTGRMDADHGASELSEVSDVLQLGEHRFRSRSRSGKSRSRSRSRQTNSSGYRSLEPEFEAFQTDERVLDTRVIISVTSVYPVVLLHRNTLGDQNASLKVITPHGEVVSSTLPSEISENTSYEHPVEVEEKGHKATEPYSSHGMYTMSPVSTDHYAPQDSTWNTSQLKLNKTDESSLNGMTTLDVRHHTVEAQTQKDFSSVANISSLSDKLSRFTTIAGEIEQFGQSGINEALQTTMLEDQLVQSGEEASMGNTFVDGLKVTSATLTPLTDMPAWKRKPELTVEKALRVDEMKSEIIRGPPMVEKSSFTILDPSNMSTQHPKFGPFQNVTDLTVNSGLHSKIPFIDASSHFEGSGKEKQTHDDIEYSISMIKPRMSPATKKTRDTTSPTRISEEMDSVDSAQKQPDLSRPGKRYPRIIKVIRRSGSANWQLKDSMLERSIRKPGPDDTVDFHRLNSRSQLQPLSTSTAEGSLPAISITQLPAGKESKGVAEGPNLTEIDSKQAQTATQTDTDRTDKEGGKSTTTVYKKTVIRNEFISESTMVETRTEEKCNGFVPQNVTHGSARDGGPELSDDAPEAMMNPHNSLYTSQAPYESRRTRMSDFTEQSQKSNRAFYGGEVLTNGLHSEQAATLFRRVVKPCSSAHTPSGSGMTLPKKPEAPLRPELQIRTQPLRHTVELLSPDGSTQAHERTTELQKRHDVQCNGSVGSTLHGDRNKAPYLIIHKDAAGWTGPESAGTTSLNPNGVEKRTTGQMKSEPPANCHAGNGVVTRGNNEGSTVQSDSCKAHCPQIETEPKSTGCGSKIIGISWRILGAYTLAILTVLFSVLVAYYCLHQNRKISMTPGEFWRWLCNAASRVAPRWFDQD